MADTLLVWRALGKGYQLLEFDPESQEIVAAWPVDQEPGETPRTRNREVVRPGDFTGDLRKSWRAATAGRKAIEPFNFDNAVSEAAAEIDTATVVSFGEAVTLICERLLEAGYRVKPGRRAATVLLQNGAYCGRFWLTSNGEFDGLFERQRGTIARIAKEQLEELTLDLPTAPEVSSDKILHGRWARGGEALQISEEQYEAIGGEAAIGETFDFADCEVTITGWGRAFKKDGYAQRYAYVTVKTKPVERKVNRDLTGCDYLADVAEVARTRVRLASNKDQFVPYLRAVLQFWAEIQRQALSDDNTRASFEAAGQELLFRGEFEKATGRKWDEKADAISADEVDALPLAEAKELKPQRYECLECGYVTSNPSEIESGGMGCVRCG